MSNRREWGLTDEQTSGLIYMIMDEQIIRTRRFTSRSMRRNIMKQWNVEIKRMTKKHTFELRIKLII